MERVILHCDLNSFYASVELLSFPELREQPVAVCGDPKSRHGIILAKNEHAKAFGVKTAETIWQAQRKCPDLVLLPSHHGLYHEYSKKVNALYNNYTDLVEPFGIDESWLDVTGTLHLFGGDARKLADRIRAEIKRKLGLTISVGVSYNKVFAKLGSDYKKPDATTVITRENMKEIVWPLPVSDLLFVGHSVTERLNKLEIHTIGELAHADPIELTRALGKQGEQLYLYARGEDTAPVAPANEESIPKSIGNGQTFAQNITGEDAIRGALAMLSDEVAERLRAHGMDCTTVQITIRDPDFKTITRQAPLPYPTCLSRELTGSCITLIRNAKRLEKPIRMLTVTALNLVPAGETGTQIDLFAPQAAENREKLERLERTKDVLRARFGRDMIGSGRMRIPAEKEDATD